MSSAAVVAIVYIKLHFWSKGSSEVHACSAHGPSEVVYGSSKINEPYSVVVLTAPIPVSGSLCLGDV